MKTKEELQAAVDEIREVCRKHGVVIIGTCELEGIIGEISIGEAEEIAKEWGGRDMATLLNNKVFGDDKSGYDVIGIGDVPSETPT